MNPIHAPVASPVTVLLALQIAQANKALPLAYLSTLVYRVSFKTPREALWRL